MPLKNRSFSLTRCCRIVKKLRSLCHNDLHCSEAVLAVASKVISSLIFIRAVPVASKSVTSKATRVFRSKEFVQFLRNCYKECVLTSNCSLQKLGMSSIPEELLLPSFVHLEGVSLVAVDDLEFPSESTRDR